MVLNTADASRSSLNVRGNGGQLFLVIVRASHQKDVKDGFRRQKWGDLVIGPGDGHLRVWFPDRGSERRVRVDESMDRSKKRRRRSQKQRGKESGRLLFFLKFLFVLLGP